MSVSSCYPGCFLELTLKSNHNPGAPIALVLTAESDSNGVLVGPSTHFFLSTVGKTHRLFCLMISTKDDIRQSIDLLAPHQVDLLIFNAHAEKFSLILSEEEYEFSDVEIDDFDKLAPDATILISGCESGRHMAQRIADLSNRTVFAPMEDFSFLFAVWLHCPLHNEWEMRSCSSSKRHVYKFQANCQPVCCNHFAEDVDLYSMGHERFLTIRADAGDLAAQGNLGLFFEAKNCWQGAEHCYAIAALGGFVPAIINLGRIYEMKKRFVTAKTWYERAVARGSTDAQCYLARLLEMEGNLAEAKKLYLQAATQLHKGAIQNLARLGVLEAV